MSVLETNLTHFMNWMLISQFWRQCIFYCPPARRASTTTSFKITVSYLICFARSSFTTRMQWFLQTHLESILIWLFCGAGRTRREPHYSILNSKLHFLLTAAEASLCIENEQVLSDGSTAYQQSATEIQPLRSLQKPAKCKRYTNKLAAHRQ